MTFEETTTDMGLLSLLAYKSLGTSPIVKVSDGGQPFQQFEYENKTYTLNAQYTVIDYDNNSKGNGMEAVLLRNDTTGQFVISFRGTQEPIDGFYDVTTGLLNLNPQIPDATAFVNDMIDKYGSSEGLSSSNLTLTGHSLGGILTQAVGADLKIQGYTFNAWSSSNLIDYSNYLLDPLGLIHRVASLLGWGADATAFAERNILNLSYTDSGIFNGDILSNTLSSILGLNEHLGMTLPVFGSDVDPFTGHRMPVMIDAIQHYNDILSRFDNKDFLVMTMAYLLSDLTGRNQFYEKGESYFNAIGLNDAAENSLSFNFRNDLTQFELAQQAKDDRAVLFALIKLNGFAVEGTLSSYSNLNIADYSSMYIQDRSLMLFHMLDPVARPVGDHYFEDMGYDVHLGSKGFLGIFFQNPEIIFGADISETLAGKDKADHLYGGAGDDVLIGNDGNDYLEGGADFDTYIAGIGDTIKDDTDNQGRVLFNDIDLTGTKTKLENVEMYEDDEFVYEEQGETLLVTIKQGGGSLTIQNWNTTTKEALGIKLEKSKAIDVSVGDASDFEAAEMMRITVALQRELKSDELLVVDLGYYTPIYRYEPTGNIITVPVVSENAGVATGAITLSHAYTEDIIVTMYTQDDTAIAGSDYTARPTFDIRIAAGETYATFDISILDDTTEEAPAETFYALAESVRTANGEKVDFTLIDVQPFTIEDDDLLPVNSLIKSKLHQKAA